MITKLYHPLTPINDEYAIVDFKDGSNRIYKFFILDEGDGKFLDFTKPIAVAQSGYTNENIKDCDFLQSTIGIPVFSERFKEKAKEIMVDDLEFYECEIVVKEKKHKFYIGKICRIIELIDEENSEYRKLADDTEIITKIKYKEEFDEDFYIARDSKRKERYEVTEKFKQFVEKENLNIVFLKR